MTLTNMTCGCGTPRDISLHQSREL